MLIILDSIQIKTKLIFIDLELSSKITISHSYLFICIQKKRDKQINITYVAKS